MGAWSGTAPASHGTAAALAHASGSCGNQAQNRLGMSANGSDNFMLQM
jgi:hypothetical protein